MKKLISIFFIFLPLGGYVYGTEECHKSNIGKQVQTPEQKKNIKKEQEIKTSSLCIKKRSNL